MFHPGIGANWSPITVSMTGGFSKSTGRKLDDVCSDRLSLTLFRRYIRSKEASHLLLRQGFADVEKLIAEGASLSGHEPT
jgi:hypothetical protein